MNIVNFSYSIITTIIIVFCVIAINAGIRDIIKNNREKNKKEYNSKKLFSENVRVIVSTIFVSVVIYGVSINYSFNIFAMVFTILIILICANYILTIIIAANEKRVSIKLCLSNMVKNLFMLGQVVCVSFIYSYVSEFSENLAGTTASFLFILNEIIFLLENMIRLGIPMPGKIANSFELTKSKNNKKDVNDVNPDKPQ